MSKQNRPKNRPTKAIKPTNRSPQQNGVIRAYHAESKFSGPLPPPEILTQYNDAIPDGAERIMQSFEKQQDHRIKMEGFLITRDSQRADRGLILGFIVTILLGGSGVWLLYLGKDITGLSVIFVPLATLVGIFVFTQKNRREEREARSKNISDQTK